MPTITVVAKIKAKQESVEAMKSELIKMVEPTRREAGCIEYRLHQDNEDPSVFIFYEKWESSATVENHKNTDHYKNYSGTVFGLIEDRSVNKLTEISC